jgi:hypothetical protein
MSLGIEHSVGGVIAEGAAAAATSAPVEDTGPTFPKKDTRNKSDIRPQTTRTSPPRLVCSTESISPAPISSIAGLQLQPTSSSPQILDPLILMLIKEKI